MIKSRRGLVMLLLALLTGLTAVLFASRWMNARTEGTSRIAVAAADVEVGAKLGATALNMMDWPSASIPPGAFTSVEALQGRITRTALTRGEPVLEGKLAPAGAKGGLSAVVGEGKRAMTVRVNDVIGVAGFALPGNYVDIMVNTLGNGAARADQDKSISKIVLERILVLAVAQEANRDETKPKVVNAVTLEVTPEQAEKLDLARSVGALSLVLRNQADPQLSGTSGATKDLLLQNVSTAMPAAAAAPQPAAPAAVARRPAAAPPPAPAPARQCVEVIRGTSRTNECF